MRLPEVDDALSRLFPPACALCGAPGQRRLLCAGCCADLPWLDHACAGCGRPLPRGLALGRCGRCPWPEGLLRRVVAATVYEYPVSRLITLLKYRQRRELGAVLGEILAARLLAGAADLPPGLPDLLLPVPLHPARLAERGFNQAADIAEVLSRRLAVPLARRLASRRRATPVQAALGAVGRRRNLHGAFLAAADCAGQRIAIVDDVITTGATALALAGALQAAGAVEIQCWSVALTVRQEA